MATMIKCDLFEQWNSLLQEAFHKWLSPETILFILLNVQQLNLNINNTPPVQPQNGQIYIYNRGITKNFKADGVNWAKKKNQKSRVQETYDTMRIDGHELHRVYCRSADDSNFQRRIYRLNNESSPIVIVHYRQCLVLHTDTISHASLDPSSDSAQQSEPKTHDDKLIHRSTTTTKHSHSSVVNLRSRQDDFVTILDTSNMPVILDFAPSSGLLHGGEKLLICLSYQLTPCVLNKIILRQENHPIKVYFGSIYVPGMLLTSSVIKCFTPSVAISGAQQITVCIFNHILSTASSGIPLLFDFYEIGSSSSSSSTSNRNRMHTEAAVGTTLNNTHMSTTTNESIQQYQLKISHSNHTHDHNHTSDQAVYTSTKPRSRKFQSVNDHSTTIPSDTTHVTGSLNLASSDSNINEHKVRVVNSDLPMSQLLQRNDEDKNSFDIDFFEFVKHSSLIIVQSTNNQSDPEVTYSNKSEDISIESLSPEILETLTQEYLCTMLTDVVMLATQDDELIEELDILDATGYNFVHYCSIFNLNSLLYTLLLRGARADILTSTGSTALHLAAAQGHTDLVKLLLQHGCDVDIHDASGWTALDLSQQNGHTTVSEYLSVHTRSVSNIPINTVDMNPYMACGINTATISDVPSHDTVGMNIYQLKSDIEENSEQASTEDRITSQVIHQVFSSLSITEKCAFAISIARTQRNKLQLDLSSSTTNTRAVNKNYTDSRADLINPDEIMHKPLSHPESKEWVDVNSSGSQYREIDDSDRSLSRIDTMDDEDRTIRSSRADADEDELQMEIQSVMSEQDVGMVMRLMGDLELSEVEREVLLIQANVRAWLLRKNYTNLRASVRSLQQAWRERKRILSSTNITATTSDTVPIGNHKLSTVPKNSSGIVVDTFEGDVFPTLITSSIETMKASSLAPISEEMECECISVGSYDLDAFPFDDTMSRGSDKDHVTSNQQTETSNITNNSSSLFKIQPLDSNLSYSSSSYGMIMDDSIVTGAQISKPIDVHISSTVPTTNDDTDRGIAATPILSSTNTSTKEMFSNLRRQAIASMVIQRNLVRFWRDKNK